MSTTIQAVEVVQSAYAAFDRGDISAILSLIADVHIFTARKGRIVRFWGMYDTEASAAARA
jgi:ketosteroid isomerase-like protein